MKRAAWLVMCPSARLVPLQEIYPSLGDRLRAITVVEHDGLRIAAEDPDEGDTVEVLVDVRRGDSVRDEAEDIALGYGEAFAKRDQLQTFDARYEITWPASRSIATFPVVLAIGGLLRARCDGVIFDTNGGTLV